LSNERRFHSSQRDAFKTATAESILAQVRSGTLKLEAPRATRVGMAETIQIVMLAAAALVRDRLHQRHGLG
jgi:hypothetical protein